MFSSLYKAIKKKCRDIARHGPFTALFGWFEEAFADRAPLPPASCCPRDEAGRGVGRVMGDGTVYAGLSPDTGSPMYVMPHDAGLRMTFNDAADYARHVEICGHGDWRLPSAREMEEIFRFRDKGALREIFNKTGWQDAFYWTASAQGEGQANARHFLTPGEGACAVDRNSRLSVLLLRQ